MVNNASEELKQDWFVYLVINLNPLESEATKTSPDSMLFLVGSSYHTCRGSLLSSSPSDRRGWQTNNNRK